MLSRRCRCWRSSVLVTAILSLYLRATGRTKDDLQRAIQLVKGQDYGIPLQFTNYRG